MKYDATNPDSSPSGELKREAFTYDSAGNRETFTVATSIATNATDYSVNALNQYSEVGAGTPVYDANGNLLTITGSGETNVYDAQSRLISASSGGVTTTFAYDAQNRCVKRAVTGGITLYYTYDDWNLIEERSGFGSQVAEYVHGPTVDEIVKKTSSSGTVYYHHNALGSTTALTDTSGAVVERYQYDVFGSVTITDGSGTPRSNTAYGNRFLYTGREWLGGSVVSGGFGLSIYDYRNRIYSPGLGRFLQTDPIRFAAGDDNIYRYVGNAAPKFVDPYGLFTPLAGAGTGAFLGFVGALATEIMDGKAGIDIQFVADTTLKGAVAGMFVGMLPLSAAGWGYGLFPAMITGAVEGLSINIGGMTAPWTRTVRAVGGGGFDPQPPKPKPEPKRNPVEPDTDGDKVPDCKDGYPYDPWWQ